MNRESEPLIDYKYKYNDRWCDTILKPYFTGYLLLQWVYVWACVYRYTSQPVSQSVYRSEGGENEIFMVFMNNFYNKYWKFFSD